MPSQIIERAYELTLHAARHSDFASFAAAEARLRTLDRQGEISARQYFMMDAIAHVRAGNTREASEAIARLGGPQSPDAQAVKHILLSASEAAIGAYREFVERLIPSEVARSAGTGSRGMRVLHAAGIAVAAVAALAVGGWWYFRPAISVEPANLPAKPTVVIPMTASASPPPNLPKSAAETSQYEQMQKLVCKVIVRWQILLEGGKTVAVPAVSGTGFVVAKDGLILTNRHVVEGGPKAMKEAHSFTIIGWDLLVAFFGEGEPLVFPGRVDHQSVYVDLATIRIDHEFPAALSFASTPTPGVRVFAYGFPGVAEDLAELLNERDKSQRAAARLAKLKEGKEPDLLEWLGPNNVQLVVTSGIISAAKKTEEGMFLQTDTSINHGNSGGPLLTEQGLVVGMATLGTEGTNLCLSGRTIYEELTRERGINWPANW